MHAAWVKYKHAKHCMPLRHACYNKNAGIIGSGRPCRRHACSSWPYMWKCGDTGQARRWHACHPEILEGGWHAFKQACKHMHPLAPPCAQARMLASQGSDSCRGPYHRRHACTKKASCPIFIRVMRSYCHARVAGAICWRGWRPPGASAGKALPLRGSALRHVGRLAALAVASSGLAVGGASQNARAPCRRLHVHMSQIGPPAAPQSITLLCPNMWHAAREAVHVEA